MMEGMSILIERIDNNIDLTKNNTIFQEIEDSFK